MRVAQSFLHGAQKRIRGLGRKSGRRRKLTPGNGIKTVLQTRGIGALFQFPPPEGTLNDNAQRRQKTQDDGPHDGPAFDDKLNDWIAGHGEAINGICGPLTASTPESLDPARTGWEFRRSEGGQV